MPNWRGFEDFGFPIGVGGLDDCHRLAANCRVPIEAAGLLGRSILSEVGTRPRARPETLSFYEGWETLSVPEPPPGPGSCSAEICAEVAGTRIAPGEFDANARWPAADCISDLPGQSGIL